MKTELVLTGELAKQILTHALAHEGTESCGLLSAAGEHPARYYPIGNVATDPATRFEMEPTQQIAAMRDMREHGENLLAIVHSHPRSPPVPSAVDIAEAAYPHACYLIVSLKNAGAPEMRAYRIAGGDVQPINLRYG
jgi:proteasome lid subunit RPN8/RPN11